MHGYSTLSMLMVRMCYVMYDRFVRVQRIINTKPQLIFVLPYILWKFNAFALMSSCFTTVFSVSNTSQMFIKAPNGMYWRLFYENKSMSSKVTSHWINQRNFCFQIIGLMMCIHRNWILLRLESRTLLTLTYGF